MFNKMCPKYMMAVSCDTETGKGDEDLKVICDYLETGGQPGLHESLQKMEGEYTGNPTT